MPKASYIAETQSVRRVASNKAVRWKWTSHFFTEAANESPPISQPDVEHVLQTGNVTLVENKKDVLWRVEGRDLDLRSIVVVAAVYEAIKLIKVVTVWAKKKL